MKIYPFGETHVLDTGTVSQWQKFDVGCACHIYFGGQSNYLAITKTEIALYLSGFVTATAVVDLSASGSFNHIYIIWDKDTPVSGSDHIIVFVNGVNVLSSIETWTSSYFYIRYYATNTAGRLYNDNTKIWKHVVSTSAAWDYNAGTGLENSMHAIYAVGNGYAPSLTSGTSSGVGYYRNIIEQDFGQITL
jgi:hypothetical protein